MGANAWEIVTGDEAEPAANNAQGRAGFKDYSTVLTGNGHSLHYRLFVFNPARTVLQAYI